MSKADERVIKDPMVRLPSSNVHGGTERLGLLIFLHLPRSHLNDARLSIDSIGWSVFALTINISCFPPAHRRCFVLFFRCLSYVAFEDRAEDRLLAPLLIGSLRGACRWLKLMDKWFDLKLGESAVAAQNHHRSQLLLSCGVLITNTNLTRVRSSYAEEVSTVEPGAGFRIMEPERCPGSWIRARAHQNFSLQSKPCQRGKSRNWRPTSTRLHAASVNSLRHSRLRLIKSLHSSHNNSNTS